LFRSGDHTVEAIHEAIKSCAEKDADEHFVFVVSDANLRRYGISTKTVCPTRACMRRVVLFIDTVVKQSIDNG